MKAIKAINNKTLSFIQKNVLNGTFLSWNPSGDDGFDFSEFSDWVGMPDYTRLVIANWTGYYLSSDMDRLSFRQTVYRNCLTNNFVVIADGDVRPLSMKEAAWLEHILWAFLQNLPQPATFIKLDDSPIDYPLTESELVELEFE